MLFFNTEEKQVLSININNIKDCIYVICEQKVMLDFDLARIYGYETKNFNRQVKNNNEKFDDDFMFKLTKDEWTEILRCKNFTANSFSKSSKDAGSDIPPLIEDGGFPLKKSYDFSINGLL